ncbi:hypothetical protein V6Z72_21070, partial [Cereibacter sphaeroides]|uniref:hypothetical protein n=1 Tax=Cereibacter sphaeroides TaxID=1063 RepID=UPI003990CFD0
MTVKVLAIESAECGQIARVHVGPYTSGECGGVDGDAGMSLVQPLDAHHREFAMEVPTGLMLESRQNEISSLVKVQLTPSARRVMAAPLYNSRALASFTGAKISGGLPHLHRADLDRRQPAQVRQGHRVKHRDPTGLTRR